MSKKYLMINEASNELLSIKNNLKTELKTIQRIKHRLHYPDNDQLELTEDYLIKSILSIEELEIRGILDE